MMYREFVGISGMPVCLSTRPQGCACVAVLLSDAPKMGHVAQGQPPASAKLAQVSYVIASSQASHRARQHHGKCRLSDHVQITFSDAHARLNARQLVCICEIIRRKNYTNETESWHGRRVFREGRCHEKARQFMRG